jgi:hypothetical protein
MRCRFMSLLLLAGMIWGASAASTPAADPPPRKEGAAPQRTSPGTALQHTDGHGRWPEILEMIWAIAGGSEMGPGEGWFHPGQSRYGWDWLADRYEVDKSGRITREKFRGPGELFDRLDRDRDGVLTVDDFDWSDRSPFLRQTGMTGQWFRWIDVNSNGRISRAEWETFFKHAAKGKDYLTREDLREALNPPKPLQSGGDEPSAWVLILGLLSGELGSMREGPRVNQRAPDFTLQTQDGKSQIRLSDFRGKKPVVLIFGSFT